MQLFIEKAMDQIWKNHFIAFTKHLPIFNLTFEPKLLQ
jgi:hypothetical protein